MPRYPLRLAPALALGFGLVLGAFCGCGNRGTGSPAGSKDAVGNPPPTASLPAPEGEKLFRNWKTPQAAVIFSGELSGYLEPCGCTQGQLGGLGRRYDLSERLRKQGWSLAQVDLGGVVHEPAVSRGGIKQAQTMFSVALRAFSAMKYDALAPSAEDFKLGVGEVIGQYLNLTDHPAVVCSNLKGTGGAELAGVKESLRVQAGKVRLGVTAAVDPDEIKKIPDAADWLEAAAPESALAKTLKDLEKDTDIQILLVQGGHEFAKKLATSLPGFDVVQERSIFADPAAEPEWLNGGKTLLFNVGKKGKYVGVVGVFDDPGAPLKFQRVSLGGRYQNAEPMRKLIDEEYQAELKDMKLVENFKQRNPLQAAPEAKFIGAKACQTCHPNTYALWQTTKHAQAFNALTANPKRNRVHDAECISCHATGFEIVSGYRSQELTPHLLGNQCENCHGPGSRHAEAPDDKSFREFLVKTVKNPQAGGLCIKCHDEDNSPKFDFSTFYPKIIHVKRDTYEDPKVHQGIKLDPAPAQPTAPGE